MQASIGAPSGKALAMPTNTALVTIKSKDIISHMRTIVPGKTLQRNADCWGNWLILYIDGDVRPCDVVFYLEFFFSVKAFHLLERF